MHTQEILRVSDWILTLLSFWSEQPFGPRSPQPSALPMSSRPIEKSSSNSTCPWNRLFLPERVAIFNLMVTSRCPAAIAAMAGQSPQISMLLFPFAAWQCDAVAFTIGLALAPVGALYSDLRNALTPLLNVLMFTAAACFRLPEGNGILAVSCGIVR